MPIGGGGVTVQIDQQALNHFLKSPGGDVGKSILRIGNRVKSEAQALCPVDTGRLRSSISLVVGHTAGGELDVTIGTNVEYAMWVHEGRGPVYARPGGVLRWEPKGGGAPIFRRSAGPARAQPFLTDAMQTVISSL